MQGVTQSCRRGASGPGGTFADGGQNLADAYRGQGFHVQVLAISTAGEAANVPDVALLLKQGGEQVLVHGYGRLHGALAQGAVQQLAADAFDAGATRAILIGAAGFTVSAHQTAWRHGHLALLEDAAMASLVDATVQPPVSAPAAGAAPVLSLRQATRPAWPVRAAIGMGGMAIAAVFAITASAGLQQQLRQMLARPQASDLALAKHEAVDWQASNALRSTELNLDSAVPVRRGAGEHELGQLPADFNRASAPRL